MGRVEPSGDAAWEAALHQTSNLLRGAASSSFTAHLDRWVAEARVDEAALARARERWLQEVAEQEATMLGVLAELAERQASVTVLAIGGRRHHGGVRVIGIDFVVVGAPSGPDVLLTIGSVVSVRTAAAVDLARGDEHEIRDAMTTGMRVHDVLTELAADRERVALVLTDSEAIAGRVRSVGHDVVVVRTDGEPPATAYVVLAKIAEVTIV